MYSRRLRNRDFSYNKGEPKFLWRMSSTVGDTTSIMEVIPAELVVSLHSTESIPPQYLTPFKVLMVSLYITDGMPPPQY